MPYASFFLNHRIWPTTDDLNQFKPKNVFSWIGSPICFVLQHELSKKRRKGKKSLSSLYEPRIFLSAEVNTRAENWHDFFNALIWYTFPKTKAALNMRQFIAFDENTNFPWISAQKSRLSEQDIMTMFDEGGCIMITIGDEKIPYLFGHAIYEGIFFGIEDLSTLTIDIEMEKDFLSLEMKSQLELIDNKVSSLLAQRETYNKHNRDLFYRFSLTEERKKSYLDLNKKGRLIK